MFVDFLKLLIAWHIIKSPAYLTYYTNLIFAKSLNDS